MSEAKPVVFVVDDDAPVRAALDSLLRSLGYAVRCFASAREFLDNPPIDAPSCLVLDVRLPGLNGLDLQRELGARSSTIPIIFITGHGDIPMSVKAMKAGAVEFLTKPFREQDLVDAIHLALDRDRSTRRTAAELADLRARFESLTPREHQILERVVRGLLNKQIAYELKLSEVTVKIHRRHVMDKMGAGSVADLVRSWERLAVRHDDHTKVL